MNLFKPFKLNNYSYRKIYLLVFGLEVVITAITILLLANFGLFYFFTITVLVLTLLFSLFVGFYEYNHLCDHYLNLKTNRLGFFFSSFSFGIFNAIIHTTTIFGMFFLINMTPEFKDGLLVVYAFPFPYIEIMTYVIIFSMHLIVFFFANLIALFLRPVKYGKGGLYLLCLLVISVFFNKITTFLKENTAIYFQSRGLFGQLLPFGWAIIIGLVLLVLWQSRTIDFKK
jgi:hypothetical protein